MKKIYLNPELIVVKIATHQMLATSIHTDGTSTVLGGSNDSDVDGEGRFGDFDEDEY